MSKIIWLIKSYSDMYKEHFKNKTVLITGGVQGIGFECAKKFVSFG